VSRVFTVLIETARFGRYCAPRSPEHLFAAAHTGVGCAEPPGWVGSSFPPMPGPLPRRRLVRHRCPDTGASARRARLGLDG